MRFKWNITELEWRGIEIIMMNVSLMFKMKLRWVGLPDYGGTDEIMYIFIGIR